MRSDILAEIACIITVVLVLSILFSLASISGLGDEAPMPLWNDGICDICGGHYLYSQVVGSVADLDYIYICENCGQIICLENNPLTNR